MIEWDLGDNFYVITFRVAIMANQQIMYVLGQEIK